MGTAPVWAIYGYGDIFAPAQPGCRVLAGGWASHRVPVRPSAASAASRGTGSLGTAAYDSCALRNGQAYCWGWNHPRPARQRIGYGIRSAGGGGHQRSSGRENLAQVSSGDASSCALDSSGAAFCWGDNGSGELGDGSFTSSATPVAVGGVLGGRTLTQIGVGDSYACALDNTGVVYCWGANEEGQLGDGSEGPIEGSDVPVAVNTSGVLAGKTITQISVGTYDACALDAAGAAYCWGWNFQGEFGDGTYDSSDVPVAAASGGALAGVPLSQIAMGERGACALNMSGDAYCWGEGDYGELGNGTTSNSTLPVAVDTSGVLAGQSLSQIAVNTWDACAVTRRAWPTAGAPIAMASSATTVTLKGPMSRWRWTPAVRSLALLSPRPPSATSRRARPTPLGVSYCWGGNGEGQLGDGSTTNSPVPAVVGPPPPTGVQATPGDSWRRCRGPRRPEWTAAT